MRLYCAEGQRLLNFPKICGPRKGPWHHTQLNNWTDWIVSSAQTEHILAVIFFNMSGDVHFKRVHLRKAWVPGAESPL